MDATPSTDATPSPTELGKLLVEACRGGRETTEAMQKAIYSPKAASIEPFAMGPAGPAVVGLEAIHAKAAFWFMNHDIHSFQAEGPYVNGPQFTVIFTMDVTAKFGSLAGERLQGREIALYTTESGKVVCEEFFAPPTD
jgi:hypothetical protein